MSMACRNCGSAHATARRIPCRARPLPPARDTYRSDRAMPARVVVSHPLPADPSAWLGEAVEIVGPADAGRAALLDAVRGADALICLLTVRVYDELLAAAGARLRIVANVAVGLDNVDLVAASRRGVVVTHTPDVLTEATADLTFALLLAAARRIVEGDALVRGGAWRGWEPGQLLGAEVHGRTLGIVGMGRIGRAVARRGRGFDMRVVYASPHAVPELEAGGARAEHVAHVAHVALDRLLAESDFVSLHCPLTDATRGLIGARELARM